jgi:hypothetical protein
VTDLAKLIDASNMSRIKIESFVKKNKLIKNLCCINFRLLKKYNNYFDITIYSAISGGNLNCIKFIYSNMKKNKCYHSKFIIDYALTEKAPFKVIKWLKNNGCEWSHMTFGIAVKTKRLKVLKWLRYGCTKYIFFRDQCPIGSCTIDEIINYKKFNDEYTKWLLNELS